MRPNCKGCGHYRLFSARGFHNELTCHYFEDTGKILPCPKDKCTEYTKEKIKPKKVMPPIFLGRFEEDI